MRLLFFSNIFPSPIEPVKGTFNRSLVRALSNDHAVRVVSPVAWTHELAARWKRRPAIDRSQAHEVGGVLTEYPRFIYPPKLFRRHYGEFLWRSVGRQLLATLKDFRPDAVVAYWTHPDGEVAVRAAQQSGIPSVVMTGGSDVLLLAKQRSRRSQILDVLHRADAVVAVSAHIAASLVDAGISPQKIHVVYRGVDRECFCPGSQTSARERLGIDVRRKVLVSVGRLVPVKGFPTFLHACQLLKSKQERFSAYIVGHGPRERSLKRQIGALRLDEMVHLAGAREPSELADWYRAADLVVLPSYSEGIPNVLLEAICCGSSFVASDVGGVSEIADPMMDRLVEPNDPMELADAIAKRLACPEVNGPRTFEPSSWKESARALVSVVQSTLHGGQFALIPVPRPATLTRKS